MNADYTRKEILEIAHLLKPAGLIKTGEKYSKKDKIAAQRTLTRHSTLTHTICQVIGDGRAGTTEALLNEVVRRLFVHTEEELRVPRTKPIEHEWTVNPDAIDSDLDAIPEAKELRAFIAANPGYTPTELVDELERLRAPLN